MQSLPKRKNSTSTKINMSSSPFTIKPVSSTAAGAPLTVRRLVIWMALSCTLLYLLIGSPIQKSSCNIQYAIMMDAGSTGSRIHVYKFNSCKSPTLQDELFHQIKPGLSSFADDPKRAAESLVELMDKALAYIPSTQHHCTPLALKATAGLRLLGADKSNAILESVRSLLQTKYPFPIAPKDGIVVMDGRDEGVYAWITVNYLVGNLGNGKKLRTAAVMDLGGASTQIVFEPTEDVKVLDDPDFRFDLNFGGFTYQLYQHSYLGFGLMEARKKIIKAASSASEFPCITTTDVIKDGDTQLTGSKSSSFAACSTFVSTNLFKKTECKHTSCSFDGIYQPKLSTAFPVDSSGGSVYAFSYFYDKTRDFGLSEMQTLTAIKGLGDEKCGKTNEDAHLCMDLAYIHALLSTGYELKDDRELSVLKKIKGFETGWCLGAAYQLLDSLSSTDLVCKTK